MFNYGNAKKKKEQYLFDFSKEYMILSGLNPNMALDVSQGSSNKNMMIIWEKHGKNNQRFKFKGHQGQYQIYSEKNGGTM